MKAWQIGKEEFEANLGKEENEEEQGLLTTWKREETPSLNLEILF